MYMYVVGPDVAWLARPVPPLPFTMLSLTLQGESNKMLGGGVGLAGQTRPDFD